MNLRLLTVAALLGGSCASYAMEKEFKMPNAEVLVARLKEIRLEHFAGNTDIVSKLADKETTALETAAMVEMAMYDYDEHLKKGNSGVRAAVRMTINKSKIVRALLQGNQEGLAELEKEEIIEPAKK